MDGSSFICNHPCIATSSVRLGSTLCIHPFTSEYPRTPVTQFPDHDDLYCKFSFTHGPDWTVVSVYFSGDGNPPNIASNSLLTIRHFSINDIPVITHHHLYRAPKTASLSKASSSPRSHHSPNVYQALRQTHGTSPWTLPSARPTLLAGPS